ncbi:MAG TPA: TlpA disulfide reductase family protein [Thermoanaerobaculia bacterium]
MRIEAGRAMIALLFAFGGASLAGEAPARLAGEIDAAGLREAIAREKGHVVLVNFWATWCVPCREEFPSLSRLQERNRSAGLRVVGVSTDFEKQRAAVEKFLAERRPPFPNYHRKKGGDDQDFIDAVDSRWGGELPFSVLYDRSGRKVRAFSGKLPIAAAEREIRKLLANP